MQIYNDGYRVICGDKHPRSLGQNFPECWKEAWPVIGEAHDSALAGDTAFLETQRIFLERHGYLEECFFTFSFSPIRDEAGRVGGLFHPVIEMTAKMLSERRIRALRDLAARTSKAKSVSEALALSAQALAEYDLDFPFVLLYALDSDGLQARLVGTTGLTSGTHASPETVDMGAAGDSVWPLEEAVRSGSAVQVDDVARRLGPPPYGPYDEPPNAALVLPILPPGTDRPAAVLVVGVSPRLPLNEAYRNFYDLLASGVTAAVANARAHEQERQRAERVELAHVVQQAVENSRLLIEQGSHELIVDVSPDPIYVNADVTRLAQVYANLLNNAAKYTEPGGCIRLTVERLGSDAVVRVRDNGVGIAAHMLPKVFELFTQVDGSLEKAQGGLGIGLSLVKGLVEMHGGTVEARSDGQGMGSEFIVRVPLLLTLVGELRDEGGAEVNEPGGRRRILVVDDNRDSAMSLAMVLKLMGNELRTAHDGLEALDVAAAFRPELILLDIGMPRLNGYDTARRIREQPWGKYTVLVALTGWGQEEDRQKSYDAGFDCHMVKPVDPTALEQLLANYHLNTA